MITPSFSLTATERVLPKLALDFTTAALDSRVTFTRTTSAANPATYVNSSGYVVSATNDQPRFDYDPVTLVCKGLLIEESRANLAEASETLGDTTYWVQSNATVSSNATTAPSNTTTGDKIIEDIATSEHNIRNTFSSTAISYVFSCYLKSAERTWAVLQFFDGFSAIFRGYSFDLANGQIGTMIGASGVSATIENAGNGWWRCSIIRTMAGTSAASRVQIGTATDTSTRLYTGNGTSGIYAWGAQLEVGAFATSYIPTTTAALTRNADVATMTGANFSSWFNATQGAVYHEVTPIALTGQSAYSIDNGTNNESIYSYDTSARYYYRIRAGAATQVTISSPPGTAVVGTTTKCVTAYKSADFGISAQGQATATAAAGNIPSGVNRLQIAPVNNLYFRKLMYWPQRLTNAEVQAFCK